MLTVVIIYIYMPCYLKFNSKPANLKYFRKWNLIRQTFLKDAESSEDADMHQMG